jgi:hypothetical protein
MCPKPDEEKHSKKISYVYRVPGKKRFLAAGIYEYRTGGAGPVRGGPAR